MKEKKLEKAISYINIALREIDLEIKRHKQGCSTLSNVEELLKFREYLMVILNDLKTGSIPSQDLRRFGMGHIIVDSWPLNSKLGDILLKVEQFYRDL